MKSDAGRESGSGGDLNRADLGQGPAHWLQLLPEASPFASALGEQLRATREEAGRTAEDVARRARHLGLSWHRSTVGQIEQGKRNVTAAELFTLPLVYDQPLSSLLPPKEAAIWLTPQAAVHGAELRRVLVEGYSPNPAPADHASAEWHLLGAYDMLRDVVASAESDIAQWPTGAQRKYFAQPDEAETKAAKRLDTTPQYVAYTARELWGHGLAAERDARLEERTATPDSPRALQAARGHITRALLNELEPIVREHEKHRGEPSAPLDVIQTRTGPRYVPGSQEADGDG